MEIYISEYCGVVDRCFLPLVSHFPFFSGSRTTAYHLLALSLSTKALPILLNITCMNWAF